MALSDHREYYEFCHEDHTDQPRLLRKPSSRPRVSRGLPSPWLAARQSFSPPDDEALR